MFFCCFLLYTYICICLYVCRPVCSNFVGTAVHAPIQLKPSLCTILVLANLIVMMPCHCWRFHCCCCCMKCHYSTCATCFLATFILNIFLNTTSHDDLSWQISAASSCAAASVILFSRLLFLRNIFRLLSCHNMFFHKNRLLHHTQLLLYCCLLF